MLIPRKIENVIEGNLFAGKVIVIYGARRVGKTTLVKDLLKKHKGIYLNCDEPDIRAALSGKTSTELANYVQDSKLVVIDEAQRIRDIGLTLKLMADNLKDVQVVATGSSSFDLSNKTKESLTGRSIEFLLTPLMVSEVNKDSLEATRLLEQRLRYGLYPDAVIEPGNAEETLRSIVNNFLYKDALEFSGLKNPETVERLVTALALQIGQEVSYTELANIVGVDYKTISTYVRLLELSFVIYRLPPLSRNLRKEISKSRKIYFWDLGIRNAVINNFNPLSIRNDVGQMWENFLIMERVKKGISERTFTNKYFWRTWGKEEIDLVEEKGGRFDAFEIKWKKTKEQPPKAWRETYPDAGWKVINNQNFWEFIG